jgi:hypothetical protein
LSRPTNDLDTPIELAEHTLSPFYDRSLDYNGVRFNSIAQLMLYRDAICRGDKTAANRIRGWRKRFTDFPPSDLSPTDISRQRHIWGEIYDHLCVYNAVIRAALLRSGPHPFTLSTCRSPWGAVSHLGADKAASELVNAVLVECRVWLASGKMSAPDWLEWHGVIRARRHQAL